MNLQNYAMFYEYDMVANTTTLTLQTNGLDINSYYIGSNNYT